jgi:pimeloyl-ACP methyl ester carboxylesterase
VSAAGGEATTISWLERVIPEGTHVLHRPAADPDAEWVVFVHGVALAGEVWHPWAPAYSDAYHLVTIDVPGYGASRVREAIADRSLDTWAGYVLEVLDALAIESAHLVAESLGGTASLLLAGRFPERVNSLVLCSTGYKGSLITEVQRWPEIFEQRGARGWSEYMNGQRFRGSESKELLDRIHAIQSSSSPEVTTHDGLMLSRVDLTPDLPAMRVPTLLLEPGSSPFISRDHALALEAALPDREHVLFGASRHGLAFAYAREASVMAVEFLARRGG